MTHPPTSETTDLKLVHRAPAGEPDVFEALTSRRGPRLFSLAKRRLRQSAPPQTPVP